MRDSHATHPGTGQGSARVRLDARSVTLLATLLKGFFDNFYNVDVLGPDRISDQAWQASFNVAAGSSPYATYACVDTWLTDFREDPAEDRLPERVTVDCSSWTGRSCSCRLPHRRFDDGNVLLRRSAANSDAGDHLALAGERHAAAHRGVSSAGDGEEG
jgi:hypothetical protein